MNNNWWEMPKFVEFTNEHQVHLWYNTIHHPAHLSIWKLPSTEIAKILDDLKPEVERLKPEPDTQNYVAHGNWEKLNHFVNNQIQNWHTKQIEREQRSQ